MGGRALVIVGDNCRRRPIGGELRPREPISAYGLPYYYGTYTRSTLRGGLFTSARALRGTFAYVRGIYGGVCTDNRAAASAAARIRSRPSFPARDVRVATRTHQ